MNKIFIENILQGIGLHEKEAKVYLSAWKLGLAQASTIARDCGLNRSTVYVTLKKLLKKDIAYQSKKSGFQSFGVISPQDLHKMIQQKNNHFLDQLPDITKMKYGSMLDVKTEFYEGHTGLKNIYNDMLTSEVDICSITSLVGYDQTLLSDLLDSFTPLRVKKQIFVKRIMPDIQINRKYSENDTGSLRHSKLIQGLDEVENDIEMYGPNKIAMFMMKETEMDGVIIHSESLYKSLMSIFKLLWNLN